MMGWSPTVNSSHWNFTGSVIVVYNTSDWTKNVKSRQRQLAHVSKEMEFLWNTNERLYSSNKELNIFKSKMSLNTRHYNTHNTNKLQFTHDALSIVILTWINWTHTNTDDTLCLCEIQPYVINKPWCWKFGPQVTPRSRIFAKMIFVWNVKTLPIFHETWSSITVLTRTCHLTLFSVTRILSTSSYPISLRTIVAFPFHL